MPHTPGPWTQHGITIVREGRGVEYPIAHCSDLVPEGEQLANARLIAKAPEMLSLLRQVVADPWDNDCRDQARALLREIEGKEDR